MTTTLSTFVRTPFADRLFAHEGRAIAQAQDLSNVNGAPVGIWKRSGWFTVCDVAPEMIEPDPELDGWTLHAVVDPMTEEN